MIVDPRLIYVVFPVFFGGEVSVFEHAVNTTLVFSLLYGLALVVLTLASCSGNDQFGQAALIDEQAQGHDGNTWLLGVAGDAAYFLAVEQQLTVAMGRVVVIGAVRILGNVHVLNPDLATDDHAIGIGQTALALANGLNLGTGEHDTCSEGLDYLVIKGRLAVLDVDCIGVIVVGRHFGIYLSFNC